MLAVCCRFDAIGKPQGTVGEVSACTVWTMQQMWTIVAQSGPNQLVLWLNQVNVCNVAAVTAVAAMIMTVDPDTLEHYLRW